MVEILTRSRLWMPANDHVKKEWSGMLIIIMFSADHRHLSFEMNFSNFVAPLEGPYLRAFTAGIFGSLTICKVKALIRVRQIFYTILSFFLFCNLQQLLLLHCLDFV